MTSGHRGAFEAPAATPRRIRVWDAPVRLLHWLLAAAIGAAWFTRHGGGIWHEAAGYAALVAVVLRLAWSRFGGRRARFADFVVSPARLWRYAALALRGAEPRHVGHNPAGGWMIVALLALAALAAASGWLYVTDRFWGEEWVERVHAVSAWLLVALVPVHVAGVLVASWRHRENLVGAMVHGRKRAASKADVD